MLEDLEKGIWTSDLPTLMQLEGPTKPFIRWAGGKQNLVSKLSQNLPKFPFNKYYEPFLGAGSMFFHNNFNQSVLSDINPHLINAYKQITKNPVEIYCRLQFHLKFLNAAYYYKLREEFNRDLNAFTIEKAALFIFLVHTSFNGVYRVNKKGEYNVPVGKLKPALPSLLHLKRVQIALTKAEVFNCMYEDVMDKIASKDLVYFDPPYPPLNDTSFFQHYTIDKFATHKQNELSENANYISNKGAYIMISNADTPLIRKLYTNWNIVDVNAIRYISCKTKRTSVNELIITNY